MADTLIETVRMMNGRAPLWGLHQWRLMNSAVILGIPLPDLTRPSGGDDRVVRLELTDGVVEYTERDDVHTPASIALAQSPAPHRGYPHKLAARAWLDAARTTSRVGGADDALLFDSQDRLVEATHWAVGWWEGETLCFPPFALGGLRSVARARITEIARGGLRDAVITRSDLARRSFLVCNAIRGIVSVGMLDGTPLPENPRTAALARRFWERPEA